MVVPKAVYRPTIVYRPIRPSDLEVLKQIHADLFPIRYESEFFLNVVSGNGIVSWAAVDSSRPDGENDELIGFVTTRIVVAKDSEIQDMLGYDLRSDQTLVYILTLGVIEPYRNLGIATSLIQEVIKYASGLDTCRAVYLHVIAYNEPAILFYKKMSFRCLRRLQDFYYIRGRHYDSFLFVYYVNGGRSPCSPLEVMVAVVAYLRSLFSSLVCRLWKSEDRKASRWSKCKETSSLLINQNKRIVSAENAGCQCV
ncbi:GNAT domain-containing protein [Cinnamomum micranthum f. kanehirae]|uniref:N-alpha-acetyltransferase 60 n=1 Tax=Cinnamomum micranthum f. kanehirae TaxID=337451 RepID=A0A3S3MWT8_9MAGN|nr:GNAT domain-containing protein [Cinnamomum micranthum f. kanehirae]